jgi:DNA polymerase-3 subunit epsilon
LLDARILAEVYLAMTGGQGTLILSAESEAVRARARQVNPARAAGVVRIVVVPANVEEIAAHEHVLALLDKASAGNTVWRKF